jgi:hypothetical protein
MLYLHQGFSYIVNRSIEDLYFTIGNFDLIGWISSWVISKSALRAKLSFRRFNSVFAYLYPLLCMTGLFQTLVFFRTITDSKTRESTILRRRS